MKQSIFSLLVLFAACKNEKQVTQKYTLEYKNTTNGREIYNRKLYDGTSRDILSNGDTLFTNLQTGEMKRIKPKSTNTEKI